MARFTKEPSAGQKLNEFVGGYLEANNKMLENRLKMKELENQRAMEPIKRALQAAQLENLGLIPPGTAKSMISPPMNMPIMTTERPITGSIPSTSEPIMGGRLTPDQLDKQISMLPPKSQISLKEQRIKNQMKRQEIIEKPILEKAGESVATLPDLQENFNLFSQAVDQLVGQNPKALEGTISGEIKRVTFPLSRRFQQDKYDKVIAYQNQAGVVARQLARSSGEVRISDQDAEAFSKAILNLDKNALSVNIETARTILNKSIQQAVKAGIDPNTNPSIIFMQSAVTKLERTQASLDTQNVNQDVQTLTNMGFDPNKYEIVRE